MAGREQPLRDAWEQLLRVDERITGTAMLTALTAATHGDRDGSRIFVTVDLLARETGTSPATVKRALATMIDLGYLVRKRRGTRAGDGRTSASAYRLGVPLQLTSEPETPVDDARSTAHVRAVEAFSRAHSEGLKGSFDHSLGLTGEPLPVVTRDTRQRRPRWCGRCDEPTRQIEIGEDHQPRRCPACHPTTSSARSA